MKVHEKCMQLSWILTVFSTTFAIDSGMQRDVTEAALHAWLQYLRCHKIWSQPWSLFCSCCLLQIRGEILIPGNCTVLSDLQDWDTALLCCWSTVRASFQGWSLRPQSKDCWGKSHAAQEFRLPWSWWAAQGSCHPCCTWDPLAPRMRKVWWWPETILKFHPHSALGFLTFLEVDYFCMTIQYCLIL